MGWTFTHKPKHQSVLDFFRDRWYNANCEVLDCAVVQRLTAYLAVRNTGPDGSKYVFGAVCLLAYRPRDPFNFGFKDMDESCGPYAYDCPERILKLLTDLPEPNEHSTAWRAACWANLEKRKTAPKLTTGMTIKLEEPLTFVDGFKGDIFQCLDPKRRRFTSAGGRGVYKLKPRHVQGATLVNPGELACPNSP